MNASSSAPRRKRRNTPSKPHFAVEVRDLPPGTEGLDHELSRDDLEPPEVAPGDVEPLCAADVDLALAVATPDLKSARDDF